ncbi:purine-nucleoside phosphorylase [Clostridium chauvoei]|uniref:Purine nucleoside phosphorylase DeoD-type n=2 Tax=Clostridium chauvoei TaxID=46867 RepID=A0A1U6JFS5_9CLOT|nr:purine-nucleoside phosphorylase [Clostridium chauvoei]ATD55297.1 purine-nucleoside phosphorylase [Clostridium chauvoei]ATD57029.1 purine-nucleoside phosphorylase [Clostridium chauvoei]MBX7279651.1 purine-nucleoside phosphorylase [Clostridium chauvoei]MBX7282020.1 purine-nucleoside phosphorylase [Clostridium chauvoei]MBX7284391.1 purine-nucleoside phosphorylase [Clostridium chauvoei]
MATHLHIMANEGDIAETVLLPGDPLRAKFIAETYLENPVCYNTVRGMYGYTGTYKGKKVSVQGTGMGLPSHSIYVNELIRFYGAKRLIRIGSAGSMNENVNVRDIVLAQSASTNSGINKRRFKGMDYAPTANFELLLEAYNKGKEKGLDIKVGNVLSSDLFYDDTDVGIKLWADYGCLAVEMESAELYTVAAKYGVEALSILTISDHIFKGIETTPEERQKSFTDMMEIALELAK